MNIFLGPELSKWKIIGGRPSTLNAYYLPYLDMSAACLIFYGLSIESGNQSKFFLFSLADVHIKLSVD